MSTKAPKRRRAASLDKRKARGGYLFVLPFILGLILIYFPVIIDSFRYSLSSMTFQDGAFKITFIGLDNYQEALFVDTSYVKTLMGGIQSLIVDIPAIVIFSLFIAVILNQKVLGRAVFRTIFFIPVICATGIMESIAAATTSRLHKAKLPTHIPLEKEKYCLPKDSIVLLEQIRTIDKTRLLEYIGELPPETMNKVNTALLISLGFFQNTSEQKLKQS